LSTENSKDLARDKNLARDFVLGALSPLERSEVSRARLSDAALDREIRRIEDLLAPLTGLAGSRTPSLGLRDRIVDAIGDGGRELTGKTIEPCDEGEWRPYRAGIEVKRLWGKTVMLRCQPGAVLAAHAHVADEHIVVIAGDFVIGGRRLTTGDYHRAPAGNDHGDACTHRGCILFIQHAS
jgi:hypothetical protein